MDRRSFILSGLGLILTGLFFREGRAETRTGPKTFQKIHKSLKEWKDLLTPEQFHVLRKEGTERPFSSRLLDNKKKGLYVCAGCELPLFTSEMKYNSRTGWPSFYTTIEGRLETKDDYKLFYRRIEYHCARCGGHQGHIFKDGPPPTYRRWCNNGVALKFTPTS